jgi:hypothetical protein
MSHAPPPGWVERCSGYLSAWLRRRDLHSAASSLSCGPADRRVAAGNPAGGLTSTGALEED